MVLTRMGDGSDGGVHSLFLVYSYNSHNLDFKIISHEALRLTFLRYSITRCRFVHCRANTTMHTLLFCPWAAENITFWAVEARCLWQGSMVRAAICFAECWGPRGFHVQEGEPSESIRKRQSGLLTWACLISDDMCKNVYIMYIFRIIFDII